MLPYSRRPVVQPAGINMVCIAGTATPMEAASPIHYGSHSSQRHQSSAIWFNKHLLIVTSVRNGSDGEWERPLPQCVVAPAVYLPFCPPSNYTTALVYDAVLYFSLVICKLVSCPPMWHVKEERRGGGKALENLQRPINSSRSSGVYIEDYPSPHPCEVG